MSYEKGWGCSGYAIAVGVAALGDYLWGVNSNYWYNNGRAAEYLNESGYSNIQYEDTMRFLPMLRDCGIDAGVGHRFSALGPTGVKSHVVVCDAPFQGAEIRQTS